MITKKVDIHAETHTQYAQRIAEKQALSIGLTRPVIDKVRLVTTELATNLLRHAKRGYLLIRSLETGRGLEIRAVDKGPGINNLDQCLEDGYSSIEGSLGYGLGTIHRASTEFSAYSVPAQGTIILSRICDLDSQPESHSFGVVCCPLRGETSCGDGWIVSGRSDELLFGVFDGSGHGGLAAQATHRLLQALCSDRYRDLKLTTLALDRALKGTRGAAMLLMKRQQLASSFSYSSVGNVEGRSVGPKVERFVTNPGILGVGRLVPRVRDTTNNCRHIILHSDGVSRRWRVTDWPGLMSEHPSVISAAIYRDCASLRDDACILVVENS